MVSQLFFADDVKLYLRIVNSVDVRMLEDALAGLVHCIYISGEMLCYAPGISWKVSHVFHRWCCVVSYELVS